MFFTKTGTVYRRIDTLNWVSKFPTTPLKTISCKIEPVQDLVAAWFGGMPAYDVRQIFTRDMDMLTWDKIVVEGITYQVQNPKPWDWLMSTYVILYCKISAWT